MTINREKIAAQKKWLEKRISEAGEKSVHHPHLWIERGEEPAIEYYFVEEVPYNQRLLDAAVKWALATYGGEEVECFRLLSIQSGVKYLSDGSKQNTVIFEFRI